MDAINLLDVAVASLIAIIFQGLWYSPIFFGSIWKKLSDQMTIKWVVVKFGFSFILLFIITFFTALMQHYMGVTSFWDGIISGIVLFCGFVLPLSLFSVIWNKKKFGLFLIDMGCWFIIFILIGTVLAG